MRWHIGGLIAALLVLAFFPLSCHREHRPAPTPPRVQPAPEDLVLRPARVLLAGDVVEARLGVAGPYEVRSPSAAEVLDRGPTLRDAVVRATPRGFEIGGRSYVGETVDVVPTTDGLVSVAGRRYRGSLRLVRRQGRMFQVVNVVPMEPYLASVINGEMPSGWPAEALKAQAVAARTYALFQIMHRSPAATFDLHPDEWSQMYLGLQSETSRSRRLVAETAGIVLTYEGHVFSTYYSSTCGGHTQDVRYAFQDPPIPPLGGVSCPYCTASKYYQWERTVPMAAMTVSLEAYLARSGRSIGEVRTVQVLQRTPFGRVARLRVQGTGGEVEMSGKAFRHAVGTRVLLSTHFRMKAAPDAIRFTGKGFGHGVGMCQVGARGAAEAGLDFLQILQYYYPYSTAVRVPVTAT